MKCNGAKSKILHLDLKKSQSIRLFKNKNKAVRAKLIGNMAIQTANVVNSDAFFITLNGLMMTKGHESPKSKRGRKKEIQSPNQERIYLT